MKLKAVDEAPDFLFFFKSVIVTTKTNIKCKKYDVFVSCYDWIFLTADWWIM